MDVDENVATTSNNAPPALVPTYKDPELAMFGKPSELPATKAMKTLVKNSVAKYQRLQDRLLKYATFNVNEEERQFADPAHLKAVKNFYQFRLVDIQRIRKETLGCQRAWTDKKIGRAHVWTPVTL